ncbi:MAG: biopolymer transporter ExbB [Planctomycetota bacterium]|nr:MAG: biopolymer transporter ExbB [Planctomycetota bacterium]
MQPTNNKAIKELPRLMIALVLVGGISITLISFCIPGQFSFSSDKWNQQRLLKLLLGPEQILCYIAFTWALLILFAKKAEVLRQSEAFSLNLLSHDSSHRILPEDARLLQRKIADQAKDRGPFILSQLLETALNRFGITKSSSDVVDAVKMQSDVVIDRMVTSMSTVNYLAWSLPAIGFLGTVRGLAGSLSMGGDTDKAIGSFIKEATSHLNVAFDCTLVALALSIVLMFFLQVIQKDEENLVLDCKQYCLDNLVAKLDDGHKIFSANLSDEAPESYQLDFTSDKYKEV